MSDVQQAVAHEFLKRDYIGSLFAVGFMAVALVIETKSHRQNRKVLDDVLKANKKLAKAFEEEKAKAQSLDQAVMELRRELYNAQHQNQKD